MTMLWFLIGIMIVLTIFWAIARYKRWYNAEQLASEVMDEISWWALFVSLFDNDD